MVSVVRYGGSSASKTAKRQHPVSVADSTRSVEPDDISSKKRRENCTCACFFRKPYTSQVLPFGERVMYKYTAVPTGNLDQRCCHGIWLGKAPMTDEHIILKENGVQKARSLHRVAPEERFVISELKKVRGLHWNDKAENLKATIVTQQDQAPSGNPRVYLTTVLLRRCQHKTFRTSRWIHRWSWEHKNAESAKERDQARRQQVRSLEDHG